MSSSNNKKNNGVSMNNSNNNNGISMNNKNYNCQLSIINCLKSVAPSTPESQTKMVLS
jgi:hypothetical protein